MRYPIVTAHCVYFRDLTYVFFFKMFSKSLNIKFSTPLWGCCQDTLMAGKFGVYMSFSILFYKVTL